MKVPILLLLIVFQLNSVLVEAASTDNQCPQSHPYPYNNGDQCCKTNKENYDFGQGLQCNGGDLSLSSLCCEANKSVGCPGGKGKCLLPFAGCCTFHEGAFCTSGLGRPIGTSMQLNAVDCCQECTKNPACKNFSFNNKNCYLNDGECKTFGPYPNYIGGTRAANCTS